MDPAKLTDAIRTYCNQTKLLHKILLDTRQFNFDLKEANCRFEASLHHSSSSIDLDGDIDDELKSPVANETSREMVYPRQISEFEGQMITAELKDADSREVEIVSTMPPGLVLFGKTDLAKAMLVNKLLQRNILPIPTEQTNDQFECSGRWRTIIFQHGVKNRIFSINYSTKELHKKRSWKNTVPNDVLEIIEDDNPVVIQTDHPLLEAGAKLIVSSCWSNPSDYQKKYEFYTQNIIPIIIHSLSGNQFSELELKHLEFIKSQSPTVSLFFVKVPLQRNQRSSAFSADSRLSNDSNSREQTNSLPVNGTDVAALQDESNTLKVFQQIANIGFVCSVSGLDVRHPVQLEYDTDSDIGESELLDNFDNFWCLTQFVEGVLMRRLAAAVSSMITVHVTCLEMMIAVAYDMTRDVMFTPVFLKYAKDNEENLYKLLMRMATQKQDEIRQITTETIMNMQDELLDKASQYQFTDVELTEMGMVKSARDLKLCTGQIQEYVLMGLSKAIADRIVETVGLLRDSCTGVLTRCLMSLEQEDFEMDGSRKASTALKEILNAAYHIEITVCTSASFVQTVVEKMKQFMHSVLCRTSLCVNGDWKRSVASSIFAALLESGCQRLSKSICNQIMDRLTQSHRSFQTSLKQLEKTHNGRLARTERLRENIRKLYAPQIAGLSLRSRSLKDLVLHGMPKTGGEIGRGSFGFVLSCPKWARFGPCAVKSVVPVDEKNWNDLAMEFHYNKKVPEHDRIVALRGSVIDYSYSGGTGVQVLLIMDGLKYDLEVAIKRKLNWMSRLLVSIDVVEGIRFLHSQGLVHRDIKLKNVLLDTHNRGKLTDLGFCKPEAMMSGSIVGTPIHMAPELFTTVYDHQVDVYAFGILFWYVCSGDTKLPFNFECCRSKTMLKDKVTQGLRPEEPRNCDPECWSLMKRCWAGVPEERPHVGDLEMSLRQILERFVGDG